MMTAEAMFSAETTDADLVGESLTGDCDAFGHIVTRYQSLVCSLAYSATGNLSLSEDLAQEIFVAAWKQLSALREPAKLRPWLCRIARNHIYDALHKEGREPSHAAEPLETAHALPALEPLPVDRAISEEEEAILWRAVECIPELYREPLILFYREQQSIGAVAQSLELTEDAVKQRLSRGRKLLTEKMAAFVEGALKRTRPGKAFTVSVLAALPLFTTSGKAAVAGAATAAQSAGATKSAMGLGGLSSVAGAVVGGLAAMLGLKASMDGARSEPERALVMALVRVGLLYVFNFAIVLFAFALFGFPLAQSHATAYAAVIGALAMLYVGGLLGFVWWGRRRLRVLRCAETGPTPAEFNWHPRRRAFEYQSRWCLFGLPLLHVKFGDYYAGQFEVACGWIAIGDAACGVLFAAGWIAFGGLAAGFVGMGLGAVGLLALGGLASGALAVGSMAFGAVALGWIAAKGATAFSAGCAIGNFAAAPHANDPTAREFFSAGMMSAAVLVLKQSYWLAVFALWPFVLWQGQANVPGASATESAGAARRAEQTKSGNMDARRGIDSRPATSGATGPATNVSPDNTLFRARRRRRLALRLALLMPLLCVNTYFFATLPHKMKSVASLAAYLVALFSFLGLIFTLIGLVVRRGFAPGWQIRCPACGLTVDAATCLARIGAIGTGRRWGWCDRCRKHRWLVIEPMPPPQDSTGENSNPQSDSKP
jgi:RNA polymerase sigma factor (sigma-70 family)